MIFVQICSLSKFTPYFRRQEEAARQRMMPKYLTIKRFEFKESQNTSGKILLKYSVNHLAPTFL